MSDGAIRPASTVALLRDAADGDPQVLLVRRNKALVFAGGFWVFPGGAVDDADRAQAGGDADAAARIAAAREAREEAGVSPDPATMVLVSHWTTPVGEKRRFSTWIYTGAIDANAEVQIDGGEIHDHQWLGAREALARHAAGELPIMPPTFITLCAIARYRSVESALAGEKSTPCPRVLPVLVPLEERTGEAGFVTMYPGDAGYDSAVLDAPGARHRSCFEGGSWRYYYEDVHDQEPLYPLD